MEAIKHIIKIPADKQIHIQLPDSATAVEKMSAMREAVNDPLFLADLNEAMEDFAYADSF